MHKLVNGLQVELTTEEADELNESVLVFEEYKKSLLWRQEQVVSQRKYPSLQEQLDMIYHDKINGTSVWVEAVTAIKQAHPKPTE